MPSFLEGFLCSFSRGRPSDEEIIINLTAEKAALEKKLLEERKEWKTEQRRMKNKITVLEKLSTDFKGSDEGLGKLVRDLKADRKLFLNQQGFQDSF